MTETRTPRFDLAQWSADSDGPSRTDFTDAFARIEARAAYDDGATVATLPSSGMVAARYYWHTPAATTYRTLWRYDGSSLYFVGGPTIPATQLFRGIHSSVSDDETKDALRIEHAENPDDGGWGGNITYAGAAYLRTGMALGDDDDTSAGRLAVGASALPASTVRMSVDSYGENEHAIVARVRHGTPGNIFRGLNAGGSAVFTVDGVGRVQAPSPSGFGGSGPLTTASLAVAPTSGVNGIATGLALYGLTSSGDAADVNKALLRAYPDSADTASILAVNRLNLQFGRIAWGTPGVANSGSIRLDANTFTFRTTGTSPTRGYLSLSRSDPADEADLNLDTQLFGVSSTALSSSLPAVVSQRSNQAQPTLSVQRVGNFSFPFLNLHRLVPDGLGGEAVQSASLWESDGTLRTGAWWKGVGTVRDSRQSVHHRSRKAWAVFGDNEVSGQAVAPSGNFTYTFPQMTVRSAGTTDLYIKLAVELLLARGPGTMVEGQVYGFECFVSVNGGTYTAIDQYEENASVAPPVGAQRNAGDRPVMQFMQTGLTGGNTFQVRIRTDNGVHPSTLYLREFILDVEECLVEVYATA